MNSKLNKEYNVCPLCEIREAIKKSSHIFPRFMGVSILETQDGKRKGYTVGEGKPKFSQDTPKEDFILCPECESMIGKLEGVLANNLVYLLKNPEHSDKFSHQKFEGFNKTYISTIGNKALKLVILSMLYRAHITSIEVFANCILSDSQNELIKAILMDESYEDIPMIILTTGEQNHGENFYYAHTSLEHKTHLLWVNDYIFLIAFDEDHPLISSMPDLLLRNEEIPFLGVLPPQAWKLLRHSLVDAAKKINQG